MKTSADNIFVYLVDSGLPCETEIPVPSLFLAWECLTQTQPER